MDTCIFTRSPNGCFQRQTYTSQTDKRIPSNKMILNDKNVDEHYIYLFMAKKQAQKCTHNMILSKVWSEKGFSRKWKLLKCIKQENLCFAYLFSVSVYSNILHYFSRVWNVHILKCLGEKKSLFLRFKFLPIHYQYDHSYNIIEYTF